MYAKEEKLLGRLGGEKVSNNQEYYGRYAPYYKKPPEEFGQAAPFLTIAGFPARVERQFKSPEPVKPEEFKKLSFGQKIKLKVLKFSKKLV